LNAYERLNNALNHMPVDRPPVICPMHAAITSLMKGAGAYYPEVQDDPIKMARLAIAAHNIAGFENVTVPFDETVETSAFGVMTGRKGAQRLPMVLKHKIIHPEDVDRLHIPDPRTEGKVPVVLEAVRLLEAEWEESEEVPILLGIISPLMLAVQLRGDHETLLDMEHNPDLLKALLNKTTEFILEYLREAVEAGVDQIVIDDSLSNSHFLTLKHFREFAEPYEDRVANEMRKFDIESILHICGKVSEHQLERMIEIDVDALSIDEEVSISLAKRLSARRHMAIIGNISPTKVLLMGKIGEVMEATRRCIDEGVDVVAPGCNLEMYTPLENVQAMTETAKRYGAERARR
jgi:[methyl-Co(III) methanol/glycine betaine-specific corrinoid protein]:coenzyme M methyltransferase